jgi:hypothetical protein
VRKLYFVIVLTSCLISAHAQSNFGKLVNGSGVESFADMISLPNGYLMVGTTSSSGAGQKDLLVVKTNLNGDTIWSKTYGGLGDEEAFSIKMTYDNHFVIAGNTSSFSASANDTSNFYIVKIDSNGAIIWSNAYGTSGIDRAKSIIETTDHNYVIIGSTKITGNSSDDIYIMKVGEIGNQMWSYIYGDFGNDIASDVIEAYNNGLLVIGKTSSFSLGGNVVFVLKTDDNGLIQWIKTYDFIANYLELKENTANQVIKGYSNNYIIVGSHGIKINGSAQQFAMDIDVLGNVNWATGYNPLNITSVQEATTITKKGPTHFVIGGHANAASIFSINSNSNLSGIVSFYSIDPENFERGIVGKIIVANDGGFVACGNKRIISGDTIGMFFKTDSFSSISSNSQPAQCHVSNAINYWGGSVPVNEALQSFTPSNSATSNVSGGMTNAFSTDFTTYCFSLGVTDIEFQKNIHISPNPFDDNLIVKLNFKNDIELTIYNMFAQVLLKQNFKNDIKLNMTAFEKGTYFYELRNKNGLILQGKLIK